MKDLILKWWNRKWSNWEEVGPSRLFENEGDKLPIRTDIILKRVSSDGLVQYKKVRKA